MAQTQARDTKLDIRLTREAKARLSDAAEIRHQSLSQFVLESALGRADEALAERQRFTLNAEQWITFWQRWTHRRGRCPGWSGSFRRHPLLRHPSLNDARLPDRETSVAIIPSDGFTCGREELDRFLIRFAFGNQQANAAQTYVGMHDAAVVGFYSLVVGEIAYGDAPERLTKGLARHPVPIMLLARLAVSTASQGQDLGAGLLKDAMRRTLQAADIGGIRAFAVHAKDDAARRFYGAFWISAFSNRSPASVPAHEDVAVASMGTGTPSV